MEYHVSYGITGSAKLFAEIHLIQTLTTVKAEIRKSLNPGQVKGYDPVITTRTCFCICAVCLCEIQIMYSRSIVCNITGEKARTGNLCRRGYEQ